MRLFRGYMLSTTFGILRMAHRKHHVYTVDMLINRATGYLKENDTAQASEKSFQGSKLVLIEYVRRLEATTDVQIVPNHLENPWNYKRLNKLCRLLAMKSDQNMANAIVAGWSSAFQFHVKGWTQNDLSFEDVNFGLPFVLR